MVPKKEEEDRSDKFGASWGDMLIIDEPEPAKPPKPPAKIVTQPDS